MSEFQITYGRGVFVKEILRVESPTVIYSHDQPGDLIAQGEVVDLSDFHNGAEIAGFSQRVGTTALKTTLTELAGTREPFGFARSLNATGNGICTTYGYIGVKLSDFYIKTQSLYDYCNSLNHESNNTRHTQKGKLVIRAVLFGDGTEEL